METTEIALDHFNEPFGINEFFVFDEMRTLHLLEEVFRVRITRNSVTESLNVRENWSPGLLGLFIL